MPTNSTAQPYPDPASEFALDRIEVRGPRPSSGFTVLTPEALRFLGELQSRFGARHRRLLARRELVQAKLDAGWRPDFQAKTASIRNADWQVAQFPHEIADRRVEITGPVDRRMVVNALNSGAKVYMADFEDSSSPTLENMIAGQRNLIDAIRRSIDFCHEETGKQYTLKPEHAVLFARPRGLHLLEEHVYIDDAPISASLFDFGLFFFHNATELQRTGRGIYFYLPKLESHLEARFWNDVFCFAQERLSIAQGSIKATVLIEHLLAAFQMDEILFELREHSAGLNCGRWDYIFSFIKSLRADPAFVLGDRKEIGMDSHFLASYSRLLVSTCHRRGAFAMGGMAAQIPIKDDEKRNQTALEKVRCDKEREAAAGYDGTWVAHPALIPTALAEFDAILDSPNQIHAVVDASDVTADDLLRVPKGSISEAGLRQNLRVGTVYLASWLSGDGCIPIDHLMEDAATAEISRTQVWQWIQHRATLADGRVITRDLVREILAEELRAPLLATDSAGQEHFRVASKLMFNLVSDESLANFLTLPAYQHLIQHSHRSNDMSIRPNQDAKNLNDPLARGVFDQDGRGANRPAPAASDRFQGITRDFTMADVEKLRGSLKIEYTLAERGARRLWDSIHQRDYVNALGALTGNQAMQMAKAGLQAIYLSGWQVAADANVAGQMYPDQSLYPANSVPAVVKRINQTLQRADQIAHMEGDDSIDYFLPIVADAEAGFGGPLNAFELMKAMIEAGAAGVHFEDQLASEKKCGHLGGKVLVPTQGFIRTLNAARLAADVCDVPTLLIARTDAQAANLITSDIDERDHRFLTGERTAEGFFHVKSGLESAMARGLAYAPYADLVWCETSTPDLAEAKQFAESIHAEHPHKLLAYNCSPSFNWKKHLDDHTISVFQRELGAMGYAFQFVTLAGFHALNHSMFELAKGYRDEGMSAYSRLQEAEFASEADGYTATRHQHEVGTSYFDGVSKAVSKGESSTCAMDDSTETAQF